MRTVVSPQARWPSPDSHCAVAGRRRRVSATAPSMREVGATEVVLGNDLVERRWSRLPFRTTALLDKRDGGRGWSGPRRDFALTLAGADLGSEQFHVEDVAVRSLPGGGPADGDRGGVPAGGARHVWVTRVVEAYPGIAGFRVQNVVRSSLPLVLGGATLDEAAVGAVEPTAHAFRAGADWREPDWPGPAARLRRRPPRHLARHPQRPGRAPRSRRRPSGCRCAPAAASLFMVAERADFPSSRAEYDGGNGSAGDPLPARRGVARPVRGAGSRGGPVLHVRAPANARAVRAAHPRGRVHGLRQWRRGRGMAAPPLPRRAEDAALPARRDVQLERHRRQRDLHRREGRHGLRHRPAGRAHRAPARHRDVHPRRRLAGHLRRLEPGLAPAPGAARHPAALPGPRVPRRARRDRPHEARPLDEPDELQPAVAGLPATTPTGPACRWATARRS